MLSIRYLSGSPSSVSLQVYQLNTGHYLCRNKYYGRGLSIEGFREALYQYMHNGKGLRQDLFEPILNKLRSLKAVLERQASYRFYSSSLLIIYEGKVSKRHESALWWCAHQCGGSGLSYSTVRSDDITLSCFVFRAATVGLLEMCLIEKSNHSCVTRDGKFMEFLLEYVYML